MCRVCSIKFRVAFRIKFGEVSCTECTGQGNDFEYGNEFPSIYNHCRAVEKYWRSTIIIIMNFKKMYLAGAWVFPRHSFDNVVFAALSVWHCCTVFFASYVASDVVHFRIPAVLARASTRSACFALSS